MDHLTFEETKGVLEGKYDVTERVWFVSRGINDASGVSCGRTIRRDGREVRDYEKIEELSDEAFDALREKAELIWSGEV